MRNPFCGAFAMLVLVLGCGSAAAQLNTAKIGAIYYQTHARTDGIRGIGVPPGADAEVGNATTLLFTYEREIAPNIGVELVLGVPPTIKAKASGTVAFLGDDVLSAKNVAPTLLFNYHFGSQGVALRPYLGAGINYTKFTNVKSTLASEVELSDSTGLAIQAGFDYAFSKEWGMFASIAKVWVKSKLVASGSTVLTTTIDFRPITYSIGASYRF
jgi:outer membrane protein